MNFLGKEIDSSSVEKIQKFMNTKEGILLKEKIAKLKPEELKKLMESAKNTNLNEDKLKAMLSKDPKEILNNIDFNKLEGKN